MAQLPAPGQRKPLSTARVESTIPTSADGAWVYPSDQMFYNAMRKKGYEPREEDMWTVVAIHNAVNERTWSAGRAARRRRQPAPRTSPSPSAQERDPALGVAPPRVPGEAAAAALPGEPARADPEGARAPTIWLQAALRPPRLGGRALRP